MQVTQDRCGSYQLLIACIALAACHRQNTVADHVVVVNAKTAAAAPGVRKPAPSPIMIPSAVPAVVRESRGPNPQLTRAPSYDPPLPPELANDAALTPLPPRPPLSAFGHGEQH